MSAKLSLTGIYILLSVFIFTCAGVCIALYSANRSEKLVEFVATISNDPLNHPSPIHTLPKFENIYEAKETFNKIAFAGHRGNASDFTLLASYLGDQRPLPIPPDAGKVPEAPANLPVPEREQTPDMELMQPGWVLTTRVAESYLGYHAYSALPAVMERLRSLNGKTVWTKEDLVLLEAGIQALGKMQKYLLLRKGLQPEVPWILFNATAEREALRETRFEIVNVERESVHRKLGFLLVEDLEIARRANKSIEDGPPEYNLDPARYAHFLSALETSIEALQRKPANTGAEKEDQQGLRMDPDRQLAE